MSKDPMDIINKVVEKTSRMTNADIAILLEHHADWYAEYAMHDADEDSMEDIQSEIQMLREAVYRIKRIDNPNQ